MHGILEYRPIACNCMCFSGNVLGNTPARPKACIDRNALEVDDVSDPTTG